MTQWWRWFRSFFYSSYRIPTVRQIMHTHAVAISHLHRSCFAHGWGVHDFQRLINEPTTLADGIFLSLADEPVGFVLSRFVVDEAEILTLAVHPNFRRQGLAQHLLKDHFLNLGMRGVKIIHLEVEAQNIAAQKLYQSFGFITTGQRAAYYTQADGSRAHAVMMKVEI